MKSLLQFFALCFFSISISAQTNTFTSTSMQSWNAVAFWSLGVLPDANHDVVISSGSSINMNVNVNVKSITVQNNATLHLSGGYNLSFQNPSQFQVGSTLNWIYGTIKGGSSLTLNGTTNLSGASHKFLSENTTLNNNSVLNIMDGGNLYLSNGNLNNLTNGVIHLQSNNDSAIATATSDPNILTNTGIIKRSGTGTADIDVQVNNNGGTFLVESGILSLKSQPKFFNGGSYNVSAGSSLLFDSTVTLAGTLSGALDGEMRWNSTIIVPNATTTNLNFTGITGVNWAYGNLNGGGTLVNKSEMTLVTAAHKFINESTTISNEGQMNFEGTGNLYLVAGTLNNQINGLVDFKVAGGNIYYSGGGIHLFNNFGVLKQSNTGVNEISAKFQNSNGIISVESGTLTLNGLSKNLINGVYNVASGARLSWGTEIVCEGALTGVLDGELFCFNSSIKIPINTTVDFNFSGSTGVIWNYTDILGSGTLVLKSKVTLTSASHKFLKENTTIFNESNFNIEGTGDFYITDGTLNNQSNGVIDFKIAGGDILDSGSGAHILNNIGLVKHTNTGTNAISVTLYNNNGTITVEQGTLSLYSLSKYLTDGVYNVSTDARLFWNTEIVCEGILTGALNGEIFCSTSSIKIPSTKTATFNFTGTKGVIWDYLTINGSGTLVNKSEITLSSAAHKFLAESTTINNEGLMNFEGTGDFYITDGTLNNQTSGLIDFIIAGGDVLDSGTGSHLFNNKGLLKHSNSGTNTISADFHNNNGTVVVSAGILTLNGLSKYLTDGVYNVSTDGRFNWNTEIVCSGTLTGVLDGDIFCSTSSIKIPSGNIATFDFTGTTGVVWNYLDILGSGTLVNKGKISLTSAANKFLKENTTINNQGFINFEGTGDFYINDGIINNQSLGVMDLKTAGGDILYSGVGAHNLNNFGLIKATSTGIVLVSPSTSNSGTIDIMSGELEFSGTLGFTNNNDGIVKGIGIFDTPAATYFTNNGKFAPGASAGILTVQGDYKSSASSVLEIEINGTNQGVNYDLLNIVGGGIFNGNIALVLGFVPAVNAEFVVAKTTGTISQCNFPSTMIATYNGYDYSFNVSCRNNNEVVLKVVSVTLGLDDNLNVKPISLYPNPSYGQFTIDFGKEYEKVSIQIVNSLGQIIASSQHTAAEKVQQEISAAAGIYFVQIKSDSNESKVFRVVKQ